MSQRKLSPSEFVEKWGLEIAKHRSGLTDAELHEIGLRLAAEYSAMRAQYIIRIQWKNGNDNMRQMDLAFEDVGRHTMLNETEAIANRIQHALEYANMRGELQFHRLAKRIPGKIKQVLCGPKEIGKPGDPDNLAAGEMLIIFASGAELRCTELEATNEETFVAKCLMLAD